MRRKRNSIDLDFLLNGNPTWEQIVEYFREGDFHEEHYLIQAINRFIIFPSHKTLMSDLGFTIEDMLNGRYTADKELAVHKILTDWNNRLGFHHFG